MTLKCDTHDEDYEQEPVISVFWDPTSNWNLLVPCPSVIQGGINTYG